MNRYLLSLVLLSSIATAQSMDYRNQIKNKPFISVTDSPYNADPTGAKDSTSALNSAIAAAQSINGELRFPCGTYLTSTGLTNTTRITYTGGGSGQANTSEACTIIKTTSAVPGIFVNGAPQTIIRGIKLVTTAITGTADGVVIGTGGGSAADGVQIDDVTIIGYKGSGINIRNGNHVDIRSAYSLSNGVDGLTVDDPLDGNANAIIVKFINTNANGRDGLHFGTSSSNKVEWCDCEANVRYNLYTNYPYQNIAMYSEAAQSGINEYIDASTFDSVMYIRDVQFSLPTAASIHIGNPGNTIYILGGAGQNPYLDPRTGRWQVNGPLSFKCKAVTYSASMTLDNDSANCFTIAVTDNNNFSISVANKNYSQILTLTIKNSSGGTLTSTATFAGITTRPGFTLPANGLSRTMLISVNSLDISATELGRSPIDIGTGGIVSDFVLSSSVGSHFTGLTAAGSQAGVSFGNITKDAWYMTMCSAHTTSTSSTSATIQLNLQPYSTTTVIAAPATFNLNNSQGGATVSFLDYIPASTSGASDGVQYLITSGSNTGGTFQVDCNTVLVQAKK